MKQLTDQDIAKMVGIDFTPNDTDTRRAVRSELRLSRRIPTTPPPPSAHATLDLHQFTEEQAWTAILTLAKSGTRTATIITGASGILRQKFPQWATASILTPYIISYSPINNGSFSVKFKKQQKSPSH
ncbi:MAG: Smr/MutS family protein [Alphaproteobacteria bacterium]|nr:Smr/MutS family protein [Alphaproteobacteria bacterium]